MAKDYDVAKRFQEVADRARKLQPESKPKPQAGRPRLITASEAATTPDAQAAYSTRPGLEKRRTSGDILLPNEKKAAATRAEVVRQLKQK